MRVCLSACMSACILTSMHPQVFSTILVVTLFLSRTPNSRTVLQKNRTGGKTHHDIASGSRCENSPWLCCVCVCVCGKEGGVGREQLKKILTMTSPCFVVLCCVGGEGGGGAQLEGKLTMTSPCFGASPARDPGTSKKCS